jgi:hypothetical protein
MKWRRNVWAVLVARMEGRYILGVGRRNLRERENLEDTGISGRIILRQIFGIVFRGSWTGLIWLRIGKVLRRL